MSLLLSPFKVSTALSGCKTPTPTPTPGDAKLWLPEESSSGCPRGWARSHLQAGYSHSALRDILSEVSIEKTEMWLKLARGRLENHAASPLGILSFLGIQESKAFLLQMRKPGPRGKVTGSRSYHLGTRSAVDLIRALEKKEFPPPGLLRGRHCW